MCVCVCVCTGATFVLQVNNVYMSFTNVLTQPRREILALVHIQAYISQIVRNYIL
jgi:hypothetical protein